MIGDRRLAVGALIAGMLLLVTAGGLAWRMLLFEPARISAGSPVLVGSEGSPNAIIEAHNTPSLAVDPADPRHLVLADKLDRPRFGCSVHFSTDGGAGWTDSRVPLPAGEDTCFIPDVAFLGARVFLVYLTLNTHPRDPLSGGNDPDGMWLLSSEDGGRRFSTPLQLPGRDNLQPRLAADQQSGRLHVVYVKGSPLQNDTPLGLGPPPNPIVVVTSEDGGRTFSDPVQVSDAARPRVAAPTALVIGGRLHVLYEDYRSDLDDYHNWAVPYRGTFSLMLATSGDGGRSFTQAVVDSAQVRPHRFLVYLPPFPALAGDGDALYAAWSDGRSGAPDVLLRRSGDGGRTWEAPVQLNHRKPGTPENYELPVLAAAGARVYAAFYAFTGPSPTGTVQYSYSLDRAAHFHGPAAVTPAFNAGVGVPSPRDLGATDFGSHLALAPVSNDTALLAWADSRRGTRDTGREDVWVSSVSVR